MPLDSDPRGAATLATQVYRRLRDDLLGGRIAPGAKLKVQDLAASYGVGASPVREALSSLAAEALVQRVDQRGFRAAPATVAEFDELLRTRCWVEELVLREAIAAGDAGWEDGIVVARFRLARTPRASGFDAAWEAAHVAFHRSLLAGCPSPTLLGFCETLRERAGRYRHLAGTAAGYPARDIQAEHEAIAEAALGRRAMDACGLLAAHYRRTGDYLRLALTSTGKARA